MRVGEKETSEYAAIVERYADLFTREQYDALAPGKEATSGSRGCARRARTASFRSSSRPPTTSCRTQCWPRGSSSAARRCRCETPRPRSRSRTTTPRARSSGASPATSPPSSTTARLDLMRRGEAFESDLTGETDPDRAERGAEGDRPPRALRRAGAHRGRADRVVRAPLRDKWLDRDPRPRARGRAVLVPHRLRPPDVAARRRVLEGARRRGLPRDARRRSASTSRPNPGSSSTSTTARRRTRAPA